MYINGSYQHTKEPIILKKFARKSIKGLILKGSKTNSTDRKKIMFEFFLRAPLFLFCVISSLMI
jgi:hypothetical protein